MIGRIGLGRALSTRLMTTSSVVRPAAATSFRSFVSVAESPSASDAWRKSCYMEIDFTISESDYVIEAIQRLAAYDIGCLVTLDDTGNISGVVSERDIIKKIAGQKRKAKDTLISEISTKDVITATPETSVDECMEHMMQHDIRHLPVLNEEGSVVGLLSIKDCAKAVLAEKEECIETLSNFAMGRGGTFVVD